MEELLDKLCLSLHVRKKTAIYSELSFVEYKTNFRNTKY